MADEKVFADGFIFKRNNNAPDFVVGRMSIKLDDAIAFLKEHQSNGWVNIDIKKSQGGKFYTELDTWKPNSNGNGNAQATQPQPQEASDDLPF